VIGALLAFLTCLLGGGVMTANERPVQISVVYDNTAQDSRLTADWGFSCFVEGIESPILFDTGGDGAILLTNLEKLGIQPKDVKILFLSHIHWDHVGGVDAFLAQNGHVEVFAPHSFPEEFKNSIQAAGALVREVEDPVTVCTGTHSTGELGNALIEQSLVVETAQGLVVITGCAHPGIVEIVRAVKSRFGDEIYLVLGGFHLLDLSEEEIREIIREFRNLGVKRVAPCHCTGERAIQLFEADYGENFVKLGAGARISIE